MKQIQKFSKGINKLNKLKGIKILLNKKLIIEMQTIVK